MEKQIKEISQLIQELKSSPNNLDKRKRLEEQLLYLEKMLEHNEINVEERYLLATAYYQIGKWEKAKLAIGKIEKTPKAGDMYLLLSKIYLAMEDYMAAESCYDLAITFNDSLVDPEYEKAFFEPVTADQDSDSYDQLIDEKLQLAEDASDAGHFELAIAISHDVLTIDPLNSYPYHLIASSYFQMEKYEAAITSIEKALEMEPDNFAYLALYGYYLKTIERYTEAKKAIETALEIDSNHSFTYQIYADLLLELDQADEALEQALKSIELEPNKNGFLILGLAYGNLSQNDKAEEAFAKVLQLSPEDAESHYCYGQFLLDNKNDPEKAIVHLKIAYELDPEDPEINELLERAYRAANI